MTNKIQIGKDAYINLSKLNRHGFIAGSTGSGKTVTLKVITELLAENGVPVFLSDIKGDLSSLIEEGETNEAISKRVEEIGLEDYSNRKYDAEFLDVFGKRGIPLRTTISQMGPVMLAQILGLNDTQEGILNIAFKLADEKGLLLIDIKDLRSVLNFVNENKKELASYYGNISSASIGAILRSLLVLENQGGDLFFGVPAFDIKDLMRTNSAGEGMINILSSQDLYKFPNLYASFLMWMLSELFESLDEVGDQEKPRLVFFFDEAHVLFNNASKDLLEKIELVVRLIRSKGVGVFFVSQKATDIPDNVLAQLSNRIQHSLRAYTPKEQKEVKAIAESFRQKEGEDLEEVIMNLKTGEALVSVLDEDSKPTFAKKAMINPPKSKMDNVTEDLVNRAINHSSLYDKYAEYVDNESAYELLEKEKVIRQEEAARLAQEEAIKKEEVAQAKEAQKEAKKRSNRMTPFERFANNIIGSIGRSVGREISRGIFGNRKR